MAWVMHISSFMKIHKYMLFAFSVLLSGCIGGIDTGGGVNPSGADGGDVGAPTVQISSGDSQIVLAWTPDPTNPGDSYELNRGDDGIYDGSATAYNDTGLTNGTRYCYTVSAVTGTGRATSAESCATPMGGTVLNVTNQSLAALLQWAAIGGAVSYNLYLDGSFAGPLPSLSKSVDKAAGDGDTFIANVVGTSYSWSGLSNNCVEYPVKIVPVDIDGNEGVPSLQTVEPDTEGSLDLDFDGVGYIQVAAVGEFTDVEVLSDGTIVALRSGAARSLVAFDDDGVLLWEVPFDGSMGAALNLDDARALYIDADENILVAGSFTYLADDYAMICRLIPSGDVYEFDADFGSSGCSGVVPTGTTDAIAHNITVDSSGRILIVGQALIGGLNQSVVARFTSDGLPDLTFATNGVYLDSDTVSNPGRAIVVAEDSSIFAITFRGERPKILKFDDNGSVLVDQNIAVPSDSMPKSVYILSDGTLLFASGSNAIAGGYLFFEVDQAVTSVDVAFIDYDGGNEETFSQFIFDCRDRAVTVGKTDAFIINADILMMRTEDLAAADPLFGTGGWFTSTFAGWTSSWGLAEAIDLRGRIMVAGYLESGGTHVPTLWRIK
jgi:hypothetical protein